MIADLANSSPELFLVPIIAVTTSKRLAAEATATLINEIVRAYLVFPLPR
jgi:hypothetical protein